MSEEEIQGSSFHNFFEVEEVQDDRVLIYGRYPILKKYIDMVLPAKTSFKEWEAVIVADSYWDFFQTTRLYTSNLLGKQVCDWNFSEEYRDMARSINELAKRWTDFSVFENQNTPKRV